MIIINRNKIKCKNDKKKNARKIKASLTLPLRHIPLISVLKVIVVG